MDTASKTSSAPTTTAGSAALMSNFTTNSSGQPVERLCFTFQLRELHITAPPKLYSHHSYYVKWERGRNFRGKFHPVACPVKGESDGVHVRVPLPMTHQFSFEVNLHQKAKDVSHFERKLMGLNVALFRYTDQTKEFLKSRSNVAETQIDLRTLLEDVRVNAPTKGRLPLNDHEYIDCSFVVTPAGFTQPTMELGGHSSTVTTATSGHSNSSGSRFTVEGGAPHRGGGGGGFTSPDAGLIGSESLVFEECDAINSTAIADVTMKKLAEMNSLNNLFSPLNDVMEKGVSKAVISPKSVHETFNMLAGDGIGEFSSMLHAVRGDVGYNDADWALASSKTCGRKSVSYMMRLGKDKTFNCKEETIMAAAGDDIFCHSSSKAPDAPMVGSSCRLEFLVHLSPQGQSSEGCMVAVYCYLHIPSSALRSMVSGKAQVQLERLVLTAEQVIMQILRPRGSATLKRSSSSRKSLTARRFRRSLTSRSIVAQSSLDPNLWRRLTDHGTLPHPHLVLQYLNRLQQGFIPKVTEQQIATLESVIVYHRQSEPIVRSGLSLLAHLCKGGGASIIASYSSTLVESLRSVIDLAEPGTFGAYETILLQLDREMEAIKSQKQQIIAKDRRYWHTLEQNIANEDVVDQCLSLIIESRTHMLGATHVSLLCAALSLHLASESVCLSVFQIISDMRDMKEITHQLSQAIERAGTLHPSIAVRFPQLLERFSDASKDMSPFEASFGGLLAGEKPRFECSILMSSPTAGMSTLYLTKSFLCFGPYCIGLGQIKRFVAKRSMLQPAVGIQLTTAGPPEFVFIAWSRHSFFQELSDMGYFGLIQQ